MTSARKWRGRHTAARRRSRFSPGLRRRWRLLPFGTASFAAVYEFLFPVTFPWPFFRLALVRPALRRFSGRETVAAIRAKCPADLMAATDSLNSRRVFRGRQIDFPPDDFVWRRRAAPLSLPHDFMPWSESAKAKNHVCVLKDARRRSLREEAMRVE
ncbi:hypothetical protein RHE_CH00858 [Rhizobium etli CFN 42]|uniref:Uncharacterized protein n=2 Tax=Rhizobium etli TaxID=29449 RepID=Q2KBW7_RHIEC|nr:hypothetical protein RHE_CH00858 [Rhizobium etli CFN 42]ARQ08958.1 hypothetical protein NXC12_CH00878 [Rhizobium etli]